MASPWRLLPLLLCFAVGPEAKLAGMRQAGAVRWKEFEADVSAAMARLRKATAKAMG